MALYRWEALDQSPNDPHTHSHDAASGHNHGYSPEAVGEEHHGDQRGDETDDSVDTGSKELTSVLIQRLGPPLRYWQTNPAI